MKEKNAEKHLKARSKIIFCLILVFISLSRGSDLRQSYLWDIFQTDNISRIHPYKDYPSMILGLMYLQPYGIEDLKTVEFISGRKFKKINTSINLKYTGVDNIYSDMNFSLYCSTYLLKKIYLSVDLMEKMKQFQGDSRYFTDQSACVSAGYKIKSIMQPFLGARANVEKKEIYPCSGVIIVPDSFSIAGFFIQEIDNNTAQLFLLHSIRLNDIFEIRWMLYNQPIQFNLGVSFNIFNKSSYSFDYKIHPVLGGSFKNSIFFHPWAD